MITLTGVFEEQSDHSWIGWVEELPGALTQGATLEEAKENLLDAVDLVLEARREDAEKELKGRNVVRQQYSFA